MEDGKWKMEDGKQMNVKDFKYQINL